MNLSSVCGWKVKTSLSSASGKMTVCGGAAMSEVDVMTSFKEDHM